MSGEPTQIKKVKKTVYIEKDYEKQIKIQAVIQEKTESALLNEILGEYFRACKS